ncbi:MAG: T9SS type A sorting domain-containing protein [Ignavibacteria bacterium]|nr:T9SS type A sorting domain-containing protein [Ignavibacteria bacterium]
MKILLLFLIFSNFILLCQIKNYEDYDDPARRALEFNKQRAYPFEEIPDFARQTAFEQMEKLHKKLSSSRVLAEQPKWKPIGPFDIGGRIKSIVFHPTKNGWVYAAGAAGGIWFSSNLGDYWEPIFDYENGIAFGSIAIDMNNPDVIYAGTGESVIGGGVIYLGNGMYKSTNGGKTWKLIGLSQVGAFSKVYVHPKNSNIVVAGATIRQPGFYVSTDAGASWNKLFDKNVTDVSFNPNNPNEYLIGVNGDGVYYTSDLGKTWARRSNGFESGVGRISVQFSPSEPDIVYALLDVSSQGLIYRSTNKGISWTLVYRGSTDFFRGQGFYNNFIEVHPKNSNIVLAGGIDIYRSSDGKNFSNVTNGYSGGNVHVDQHCAAFNPFNPNIVMVGNDGGVYLSTDAGITWRPKNNNLQVTQFYGFDIDHTKPNINFGGTQDNGTLGNLSPDDWEFVAGGDGFRTVIDYINPNIIYGQSTPSGVIKPFKLDLKSGSYTIIDKGIDFSSSVWDPPLTMDPQINYILYYGRDKLYATYSGGNSWEVLPTPKVNGRYTAIEVSPLNSEVIMAGTSGGDVIVTTDGGERWTIVSNNGLVNRWVTDIAFSNQNQGTAFVSFSGFYTPHIFKTTDFGKNWYDIGKTLPDIPVNTIAVHPFNEDIVFVGTDIGVFATYDGGTNWFPFGEGLPRSPVTDLKFCKYQLVANSIPLRAATHGRGIWEADVPLDFITNFEITSPAGGEIFVSTTKQVISWYGFTPPVKIEFSPNDGIDWRIIAENVASSPFIWNIPNVETELARIKITSLSNPNQVKISNTFTISIVERGSILQNTSVNFIPYGIAYDGKEGLWVTSFGSNQLTKLNANTLTREKSIKLPGDSLFTDIAFDRDNNIMYIHRMNSTSGNGGVVLVLDTNGNLIRQFTSPANVYPTGIEVFDGKLLLGDRDKKDEFGKQVLMVVNPSNGSVEKTYQNPYSKTYGPRGLAYDREKYVYQVGTFFPSTGSLTEAVISKIPKENLSIEVDRIVLQSPTGIINARGIEFDPRDKNFWITDYAGNIYKLAGFDLILSISENQKHRNLLNSNELIINPNPAKEYITVSFKSSSTSKAYSLRIIDVLGNVVIEEEILGSTYYSLPIDISNITSGIYFAVLVSNGGEQFVNQFCVMK